MDTRQYHEIAELDGTKNWWYVSRRALVESILSRYVASSVDTALDLGCGTGAHAGILTSRARHVTGLDPSEAALEHARDKGYASLIVSGAEAMPLPDASIDLVLATDVLEHVDDMQSVKEIVRILRPGGHIVATVPAWMSLWHGNDDHSHHKRRYSRAQFTSLFENNGYTVKYIRYWNRLFFLPVWITARLYRADRARLKTQRNNLSAIPGWLGPILIWWFRFENAFCDLVPLPFGVSLLLVAEKKK